MRREEREKGRRGRKGERDRWGGTEEGRVVREVERQGMWRKRGVMERGGSKEKEGRWKG